jgi:asparagine synthase (glutamine-hydrolysing)
LKDHAREILLDRKTLERGYFRERSVRLILEHHVAGRRDYSDWIWNLLVLELWFRTFIDRPDGVPDRPASAPWRRHIQDVVT